MGANRTTYFLAPTRDCPPDGPVALGSLITDPREPEFPLNYPHSVTVQDFIKKARITSTYEEDAVRKVASGVSVEPSIWSTFLAMDIGPTFAMGRKTADVTFTISKLITRTMNPDMVAVKTLFEEPRVQAAVKDSRFSANLYLITGVQIAHGTKYHGAKTREVGGHLDLSGDLTSVGAPVSAGAGIYGKVTSDRSSSGQVTSEFVFAYCLREISYRRKNAEKQKRLYGGDLMGHGEKKQREHTELSEGDEAGEENIGIEAELLGLKDEDPRLPEYWDLEVQDAQDFDDNVCQVVLVGERD